MKKNWIFLLISLLLLGCYSNKNKTEERARERVTQFVLLIATEQWEEVEKLLSSTLMDSEYKEVFLSNFDSWQLKDTTDLIIDIRRIYIPEKDPENRALVSMNIRSKKHDFTKLVSMPIRYEKGDWYIGS
jgi:hypothetical protein